MIPNIDKELSSNLVKNKRDEFIIEIRKRKNEEYLNAKRFKFNQNQDKISNSNDSHLSPNLHKLSQNFMNYYTTQNFEGLKNVLQEIRKFISSNEKPPIKSLISTQICPYIANMLDSKYISHEKIQHEAAWIFTNLASGQTDDVAYVVQTGCIPRLVNLVLHSNDEISEQAIWALANIAGDSLIYRDKCIESRIVDAIIEKINGKHIKMGFVRTVSWAISNICRGKPQPDYEAVSCFLPLLQKFIKIKDEELLIHVLWSLSFLSDGDNDKIEKILDLKIIDALVSNLSNKNILILIPTLRAIGNLITGTDEQTESVLQTNLLEYLEVLLTHPKKILRKESCWTISNILAGNYNQIQHILNRQIIIKKLIQILYNDEPDIVLEALACFSNITYGGLQQQIDQLVEMELIDVIIDIIGNTNLSRIVIAGLDIIKNILRFGNDFILERSHDINPYAQILENCGGVKLIERLQHHPDPVVYDTIVEIIEKYFQIE